MPRGFEGAEPLEQVVKDSLRLSTTIFFSFLFSCTLIFHHQTIFPPIPLSASQCAFAILARAAAVIKGRGFFIIREEEGLETAAE